MSSSWLSLPFSLVSPSYHRVGRGVCDGCGGAFSFANAQCVCGRCDQRLCRRCYSRSCTLTLPCLGAPVALPFVARARAICDACAPEADRERAFETDHLPFLEAGALVTRVQPSLLGEAAAQVLLSLVPARRALLFRSMQLNQDQQPRDCGEVKLDDVSALQSGQTGAAAAGLQLALGAGAGAAAVKAAGALASALRENTAAPAPYDPRLVLHLVSARGRTVLIVACTDERSFARWSAALTECLALAKSKHSAIFPSPAAMAAAAAAAQKESEGAAARGAEVAARQAEREAFRQRIGPVGMANTAAIMAAKGGAAPSSLPPAPGLNPAARGLTQAPPPPPTKEQLQEQRAFDSFFDGVAPRPPPQGAGGLSAAALASRAQQQQQHQQQQRLTDAQVRAQVALNRAASAASTGFAAFRDGLGSIARQIEASMPPPAPGQR